MNPIEKLKHDVTNECGNSVCDITSCLFQCLSYLKFFEPGMKSPSDGKIAVEFGGVVYVLSIERTAAPNVDTAIDFM